MVWWPLSRSMRNIPLRNASVISPSSSMVASLSLIPLSSRKPSAGQRVSRRAARTAPARENAGRWARSDDRDLSRLGPLLAGSRLELDASAFGERLIPAANDARVVDEEVLPSV